MCTTSVRVSPAFARHRSRETISTIVFISPSVSEIEPRKSLRIDITFRKSIYSLPSIVEWQHNCIHHHHHGPWHRHRHRFVLLNVSALGLSEWHTWALDAAIALLLKYIEYWICLGLRTRHFRHVERRWKKGARVYCPPSLSVCLPRCL